MRYFITGATGFIGRRVARQLLEAGHEVIALARRPEAARDLADRGAQVVPGDITDRDSLRGPMAGVDGVFHLAAWYEVGVPDTSMAERINVGGTRAVLEVMRDLGIQRGVYTSTIAVFSDTHGEVVDESYRYDGPHLSEYDRTKWLAHYEVALPMMEAGLPLTIVQPGIVYGPGDHSSVGLALRQYLRRALPVLPQGFTFCLSHVEDSARGHILAMEKGWPGETYIIGGPIYTMVEMFRLCQHITGIPAPRLILPPGMMRLTAALATPLAALLPPTFHPESLRVSAGTTYTASSARAERDLGWRTRPVVEGLRETLAYELRQMGREPDFDA